MKIFHQGFHLIEILFALSIISITISLGYPMFADYLMQAKRTEAKSALNKLALAMETFYATEHTYEFATLSKLKFPERIAKKSYHIAIHSASESDYLLTATPIGKQAQDKECSVLSLRANNERGISGYGNIENCWG